MLPHSPVRPQAGDLKGHVVEGVTPGTRTYFSLRNELWLSPSQARLGVSLLTKERERKTVFKIK